MRKIVIIIFLAFVTNSLNAQFEINYPRWYKKTKVNMLYANIGSIDTNAAYPKKLMSVIRESWKISPVSFISGVKSNLLVEGNLFLELNKMNSAYLENIQNDVITYKTESELQTKQAMNKSTNEFLKASAETFYFLNIWTVEGHKKHYYWDDLFDVAKTSFFPKHYSGILALQEKKGPVITASIGNHIPREPVPFLTKNIFDSAITNAYLNATLGNIKNMVQRINDLLQNNKEMSLTKDIIDKQEITKLKTDTLYVPNYWYGDPGTFIEMKAYSDADLEATKKEMREIFEGYTYNIKIIPRQELSDMIVNANKSFYYLNWVQNSLEKVVNIIDGYTGKIIYSENVNLSMLLKPKDVKKVVKAID